MTGTKSKKIIVEVDASTWRWLRAFARANSNTDIHPGKVTEADILAQAAFCVADHAGRRNGSWEASVAQSMMDASGYQESVGYPDYDLCLGWDTKENERWNAARKAKEGQP